MNYLHVWNTINTTEIDISLLPVDIVPLTDWSTYLGLLRDHLSVLTEIQHHHNTEIVSVTKIWLTQQADWDLYREHITIATTSIEWTVIDTNEANITKAIQEAAEFSIPKSSGKSSTPYWNNNMGTRMAKLQYQTKGIQTTYITGQSGASTNGIQRVYTTVYPCEKHILEPVDHQIQQQYLLSRGMEKNQGS